MKIDFWFPYFELQAAKLKYFNLESLIFQKIWTIEFQNKFSKLDDVI